MIPVDPQEYCVQELDKSTSLKLFIEEIKKIFFYT